MPDAGVSCATVAEDVVKTVDEPVPKTKASLVMSSFAGNGPLSLSTRRIQQTGIAHNFSGTRHPSALVVNGLADRVSKLALDFFIFKPALPKPIHPRPATVFSNIQQRPSHSFLPAFATTSHLPSSNSAPWCDTHEA
jgi:hypothetical protein